MFNVRVSIVKYTNSLPFLYGLENSSLRDKIELTSDTPAECYENLLTNKVDIGLVPVVLLNSMTSAKVIGTSCISSRGKVHTVILASRVKLEDIKTIYLDYQSRTSVNLIKVLCKHFWKIQVAFLPAEKGYETKPIPPESAFLIIGDRCFPYYKKDYIIYDLSEEWVKFTHKPFVFAAWVANKNISAEFEVEFNEALKSGIAQRDELIQKIKKNYDSDIVDLNHYFYYNLNYDLGTEEIEGMKLFLNLLLSL